MGARQCPQPHERLSERLYEQDFSILFQLIPSVSQYHTITAHIVRLSGVRSNYGGENVSGVIESISLQHVTFVLKVLHELLPCGEDSLWNCLGKWPCPSFWYPGWLDHIPRCPQTRHQTLKISYLLLTRPSCACLTQEAQCPREELAEPVGCLQLSHSW